MYAHRGRSEDRFISMYSNKNMKNVLLLQVPGHEYRPNGFSVSKQSSMDRQPSLKDALLKHQAMLNDPLLHTKEPEISYVSNKLHPYHSLPLNFSSPADSDNSKTGSMPRSVHRYRGRHPKHPSSRTPSVKNELPQQRYEDLFDRTLERMTTHSHMNGDAASERSSKAKRNAPLLKGASLSTRSPSPMYSSQENVMSDTDELRTESDVSPPP